MPDPDGSGNDEPDLWLNQITRKGVNGSSTETLPPVNFNGVALRNRVVASGSERKLFKFRIDSLRTETGGRVAVEYGHDDGKECDAAYVGSITKWQSEKECFPQKYAPPNQSAAWEWFHKYVVTRVGLGDDALGYGLGQGATNNVYLGKLRVYDYTYLDKPAWRYSHSRNTPSSNETWNDWRGYQTTVVKTRDIADNQTIKEGNESLTRFVVYRGMDGSKKNNYGGAWDVKIDTVQFASSTDEPSDSSFKQGMVAEETLEDENGDWITRTYHDFDSWPTAEDAAGIKARHIHESQTLYHTRKPGGVGKNTRTVTTKFQDANGSDVLIGAVTAVMDTDWEGVKTCTDTTWKNNTNPWIRAPLSTKVYSGPGTVFDGEHCAASAPLLSRKSNQYDNDAPNLTKGLLTKVSTNTSGSQWSHASTTYDDYGRVTSVTDANGNTTETLYNGMTSISSITNDLVTQTKVKLPKATSSATTRFVITTELDPRRGTPTLVTDPNGNITRLTHDPLGRLTQVRYPGNGATSDPSVEYTYTVTPTTPSKVKTRVQRAAGVFDESYTFHDGWGRTIETQVPNVNGNFRLVAGTAYDEQGLVRYSMPLMQTGYPGSGPSFVPLNADPDGVKNRITTDYDAAARPTKVTSRYTENVDAVTKYAYDGNLTTVEAPGTSLGYTTTAADAHGRTTWLRQHEATNADGSEPTVGGVFVTYDYDGLGQLTGIHSSKADGDALLGTPMDWSYSYDLAGRRIGADDPDVGATSYGYDGNGNQTKVDTIGEDPIYTNYDNLNRPTDRRLNDPAGSTLLAEWTYDTASGGKYRPAHLRLLTSEPATPSPPASPGTPTAATPPR